MKIRFVRIAALSIGGFLLAGVAFIHTPPAKRYALSQLQSILARQGITFDASGFDYNLLSLRAQLRNVVVRSAPDMPPLLRLSAVDVDASLMDLIRGKIVVTNAALTKPEIFLLIDASGRSNLPEFASSSDESSSKRSILLEFLSIREASLRYEDRKNKVNLFIPQWQVTVDGNRLTERHRIAAQSIGPIRIHYKDGDYTLDWFQTTADLGTDDVKIEGLNVEGLGAVLKASGSIRDFKNPTVDMRANADAPLERLAAAFAPDQKVAGQANLRVAASGAIPALQVTGHINAAGVRYDTYKDINLDSAFSYDAKQELAVVQGLKLNSPLGNATADANLALKQGVSTLTANVDRLRLDAASRIAKSPTIIASTASGSVRAQWPALEWQRSTSTVQLTLHPTQAPASNVLPVSGSLNARLRDGAGTVQVNGVSALGATVRGSVGLTAQQQLSGTLELAVNDFARTAANAATVLKTELPDIQGQANATIRLAGTLKKPEAAVQLQTSPMKVGTLDLVAGDLDARYRSDRIEINHATLNWHGESLVASGTIGLDRAGALNLNATLNEASIESVLRSLGKSDIPVSGRVNMQAHVTGTTKKPAAEATITADDLIAYQQPFGSLTATANMSPDQLVTAQAALNKTLSETLTAQGSYSVASRDLTATVNSDPLTLTTFTVPGFGLITGSVALNANTAGTAADPHVEATVAVRDLVAAANKVGDIDTRLNYASNQVQANLAAPKQNLTVEGQVTTLKPYAFTVQARAQNTDLASLPLPPDVPLTGQFSLQANAAGNAGDTNSIDATLRAERLDLRVKDQPISLESPLDARFANNVVTINSAAIRAPGTTFRVQGSIPLDVRTAESRLTIDANADLAEVSNLLLLRDKGMFADGRLVLQGGLSGTLKEIEPDLTLRLDNGFFDAPNIASPVSNLKLEAYLRQGALSLQSLAANWMNADISGSGTVPLGLLPPEVPLSRSTAAGPARVQVALNNLDLSRVEGAPAELKGQVSVALEASAPRPVPEAVEARLSINTLTADYQKFHIEQDGVSAVRLQNGVATVEQFRIKGPQTQLALTGNATVLGPAPQTLDMRLEGATDIGLLTLAADTLRAQGQATIQVAAQGPLTNPQVAGFINLAKGEASMRSPRIEAQNLNLRMDLAGRQINLTTLEGSLNGGRLRGSGSLGWDNGQLTGTGLSVNTRGVYLDFPANLRTVSDVDLKFGPAGNRTLLSGNVNIREGSFTETLTLEEGLFTILNRTPELDLTEERNAFLEKLDFGIGVKTAEPIIVDNNLAKVELAVDTRVVGNYYQPGLTGRVTFGEGGELNLNERQYLIDRGVITFVNEQRIEPSFDILAHTEAAGYDITLAVNGSGKDRETTLTSDPPLSEPDIAAVLLTGRTLDRLQGSETDVAKEQVLSYLTGRVGGSIGRGLQQATGLSQVRIEPNLIANESDPSARLTLGQNLTRQLSLIYSMNLINSGDQIIVGQYDFTKRFRTRALKQTDNSYRFDFSRVQEFGGALPPPKSTAEREKRTVGDVRITGETVFSEEQIRKWLKARQGKRYDFFQVRKGLDKIENKYADAGMLESRVRLHRARRNSLVDIDVEVTPGPKVDFVFEGYEPSRGLRKQVRETWQSGVFDTQRAGDAAEDIRRELLNQRYVEAKVDYQIDISQLDRKRVTFDIQPGTRFDSYKIIFAGAKEIEESELREIVRQQKFENFAITQPKRIIDVVAKYYHEKGYLDAKLGLPELITDSTTKSAQSVFPVAEGPLYQISRLDFEGNKVYTAQELAKASTLEAGNEYSPEYRQETIDNLRVLYGSKGYNDAEFSYALEREKEPGTLRVLFRINEGPQSIIDKVEISGTDQTNDSFVGNQLAIKPGDPVNLQAITQSRRNLYTTGAFSLVDIERSPQSPGPNLGSNQQPVNLNVRVQELRPFLVSYGGYFDTDRGPGGILDVSNRNSLGMARTIGLRTRYDSDLQEGRLYFTQPLLRNFPIRTTASSYLRRETREGFNTDRIGFSLLQESRFRKVWLLNYGYRWEKTRTYERGGDPLFDTRLLVAPFTASISRDSRDDILDASQGQFTSHAVDYAPNWAGSELNFVKYFGQYFKYIALDKPKPLPLQKGLRKSRFVYAGGVRVGLAAGLNGQDLIPGRSTTGQVALGERFFTGGGTTVRGFQQDGIGPRLSDGVSPAGGDAMFILNNELRFPLVKIFDGVGFLDMGNIYDHASDFRPWDLRKAAGLGIRIRTPYFLIRFDYGIKLDRKPGEPLGRPFFSIGQAF